MIRCASLCLPGLLVMALAWLAGAAPAPAPLPEFDFTKPDIARQWGGPHHISALEPSAEGLRIVIDGHDPYFHGPPRNFPAGQPLWLRMRLKSSAGGTAQLFYFAKAPAEEDSRRFFAPAGEWTEVLLPLPALGPGYRLRFDPPGDHGDAVIAWMRFEPRIEFTPPPPNWQSPVPARRRVLQAGALEWWDAPGSQWGGELRVQGRMMAYAHPRLALSLVRDLRQEWMPIPAPSVRVEPRACRLVAAWKDARGAAWRYQQELRAGPSNVIEVTTTLEVSQDTEILYAPMFLLAAGERSFGTNKNQALFAGLEYLENEPSSSEADIEGAEALRQVPSNHKITFPLMAIQEGSHYVAITYADHLAFSAVFDSPDRLYGSAGHVMGVLWPESGPANRREGSLVPDFPRTLKAGQPLVCRLRLMGGRGGTVVPAVQQYVALHGLPKFAKDYLSLPGYVELAAEGWLRSKAREGNRYRHAVWPGFNAQPAADAALYQDWLAGRAHPALSNELRQAAAGALSMVAPNDFYHSAISHVRTPAVPLVFGRVRENIATARATAENRLRRLGNEYVIRYRAEAGRPDYARTYWTNHANGFTFQPLADLLEAAAFCGDRDLTARALAALRAQERYRHGVPRGAQTWEIPLHTPDILASAHLVRAYVTGYELSGDRAFLEEAQYWAWTGIPFVYLANPTGQEVGIYGTIAVLGATTWKAPVWFGQPVQWCGLVYSDALYRLAQVDPRGIWRTVADGITVGGLQHTWKATDANRVGLLPDYFLLHAQASDGPAINPGTVGANAASYYTQIPLYDFRRLRQCGVNLHAPGLIMPGPDSPRGGRARVFGWPAQPYFLLLSGLPNGAQILLNGRPVTLQAPHEADPAAGWAALQVSGQPEIEVRLP